MANKAKRAQIVALKTDGVTWSKKVNQLIVCRKTVYNARKQFQESSTASGKLIPWRKRTVRTQTIFFCNAEEGRAKSVEKRQKMAKYTGISRYSMRRVIIDDLQLTQYKKQSVQVISESSKLKSLDIMQVDVKGNGASRHQDLHLVRQKDVHGGGCDQ